MSRFGGGNRQDKKKNVIEKLKVFFEKYFGVIWIIIIIRNKKTLQVLFINYLQGFVVLGTGVEPVRALLPTGF